MTTNAQSNRIIELQEVDLWIWFVGFKWYQFYTISYLILLPNVRQLAKRAAKNGLQVRFHFLCNSQFHLRIVNYGLPHRSSFTILRQKLKEGSCFKYGRFLRLNGKGRKNILTTSCPTFSFQPCQTQVKPLHFLQQVCFEMLVLAFISTFQWIEKLYNQNIWLGSQHCYHHSLGNGLSIYCLLTRISLWH